MVAAANKAGRALIHDFGEVEQLQVSRKGPGDYVSTADINAEQIIRYELKKARPTYSMLLEEAGIITGTDSSNRWVVDPLDGTFNFLHGLPHFSISIALERDGSPMCGVVYDPVKDELFWAERGQGAFLNDRRLRAARQHLRRLYDVHRRDRRLLPAPQRLFGTCDCYGGDTRSDRRELNVAGPNDLGLQLPGLLYRANLGRFLQHRRPNHHLGHRPPCPSVFSGLSIVKGVSMGRKSLKKN